MGENALTVTLDKRHKKLRKAKGTPADNDEVEKRNKKPTPADAVVAIIQAYAIVALVLTVWRTIFGESKPPNVNLGVVNVTGVTSSIFQDTIVEDVSNLDEFLGVVRGGRGER